MVYSCPMNPNVDCHKMECQKCGWNPVVAHLRLEEIKKKLGVTTDGEGKPINPNTWVYE